MAGVRAAARPSSAAGPQRERSASCKEPASGIPQVGPRRGVRRRRSRVAARRRGRADGAADAIFRRQRARHGARARRSRRSSRRRGAARRLRQPHLRAISGDPSQSQYGGLERREDRLRDRALASRLHLHFADADQRRRERAGAPPGLRPQRLRLRRAAAAGRSPRHRLLRLSGCCAPATTGGWREVAIFQGASFFRSLARGQNLGVNARGLSIRTGEPRGEEFPLFRAFWIEKPSARGQRACQSMRCSIRRASTGAYRFTAAAGRGDDHRHGADPVRARSVDHFGLAPDDVDLRCSRRSTSAGPTTSRAAVYDDRRPADAHRRGRMAVAAGLQPRDAADLRLRRP